MTTKPLLIFATALATEWAVQASERAALRPDTLMLDELNVVALKQQDRLLSQPLAVSLLGHEELQQFNVSALHGISDVVPNLFMPEYGSRATSSVYMRGIGTRIDQPSVGLVVDNVPLLNKNSFDFDLADIASVEVLRGPQSTLYGRNTIGGLINISTSSPLRTQSKSVSAESGTHLRSRVRTALNFRPAGNFGLGVSANFTSTRGEHHNDYNGSETDRERSGGLRVKAEWQVKPRVRLVNTLSGSLMHQAGYPYENIENGRIAYDDTCFYRRFTLSDALTVRHTRDHYTFTSVTSVQYLDDNLTLDQDFLPQDYFTLTQKQRDTGLTQDLVWHSAADASAQYSWLAGLFGFWRGLHMEAPVTFKDTGIAQLIEQHRNQSNPQYPIRWQGRQFPLNSDFSIPAWGLALYHESGWKTGRFKFTGALRFDFEHMALTYHSYCNTGYDILAPDGTLYRSEPIDIDDRGHLYRNHFTVLPKVAALAELDNGLGNLYASVSRGYKSGGYNTQMFSEVLQQRLMNVMGMGHLPDVDETVGYKPEDSWNYEIGAHLTPADGLRVETALFYIDMHDQQLTRFPPGSTTGRMMTNAGRTRSYGAEVSVQYAPSSHFWLNGSYGWTDARFVHFYDGRQSYAGKRVPYVPVHTFFLQGVCDLSVGRRWLDNLTFDLNLRGTGNIYWDEANTRRQPFYLLLGAGLTASINHLDINLWGRNITGTHYDTFYFVSMGNEFVQRAKTAEFGITATLKY